MPDIPMVVLGAGAVGKSCLTIQFIQGHFVDRYDSTIEDVYRKPIDVDGTNYVLTIVDTAGQDAFGSMRESYMKKGKAFVLVYSTTDPESFQHAKKMYAQLRRTRGESERIACIVVGNKTDLVAQRAVATDDGANFARVADCPFREVTAKDRAAVDELFTTLVRTLVSGEAGGSGGSEAPRQGAAGASGRQVAENAAGVLDSAVPPPAPPLPMPAKKKKRRLCTML